jgi:outer membrane translocation and assembly module TamA
LKIDNIENIHFPLSGYSFRISAKIYPKVFQDTENFSSAEADIKTFFSLKNLDDLVIALRAGGRKLLGQYPFFASASLGGRENLRGYSIKRFSGDASLFGQIELRKNLLDLKLILKTNLGLLTFIETGRVFAENENSNKWHPSYGIGAFLSYLNSALVFNTYVAFSPEDTIFSFGFDLPF